MRSSFACYLAVLGIALSITDLALSQGKKVEAKQPIIRPLRISVGSTVRVQMTTKRPIQTVFNESEHVLRVSPMRDDPTTVLVTGLMPGTARIYLTDTDGKTEILAPGRRPEKR
jgi:hypothetical protein